MAFGIDGDGPIPHGFAKTMRRHHINYIFRNDPCPRAWGKLSLQEFIELYILGRTVVVHDPSLAGSLALPSIVNVILLACHEESPT